MSSTFTLRADQSQHKPLYIQVALERVIGCDIMILSIQTTKNDGKG